MNIQNENIPDKNGVVSFQAELENTSCFYFCNHFYKNFKDKVRITGASVIRENRTKEYIYIYFEVRKFLIQFYPIVTSKSKYIIYVDLNVASE